VPVRRIEKLKYRVTDLKGKVDAAMGPSMAATQA